MELTTQDETLAGMARASIDSALSTATGTELQRINFFSNGFKISEGLWKIYDGADSTFISNYQNFLKDSIAGNQMYISIATSSTFLNDINNLINQIKAK